MSRQCRGASRFAAMVPSHVPQDCRPVQASLPGLILGGPSTGGGPDTGLKSVDSGAAGLRGSARECRQVSYPRIH